jgi:hypothetical protein
LLLVGSASSNSVTRYVPSIGSMWGRDLFDGCEMVAIVAITLRFRNLES